MFRRVYTAITTYIYKCLKELHFRKRSPENKELKLIFCNLDIIPNSAIIVLVKYVLNRKKNQNWFCNSFYAKNKVIFLKHPVFLI